MPGLSGELVINDENIVINEYAFILTNTIESNSESELVTIAGSVQSDVFKKEVSGTIYAYSENQNWEIPISFIINGNDIIPDFFNSIDQQLLTIGDNELELQLLNMGYGSNPMQLEINSNSDLLNINNLKSFF